MSSISKENKVIWTEVLVTYFKNANLPTEFVTIYFINVLNEKDKEVNHQRNGKVIGLIQRLVQGKGSKPYSWCWWILTSSAVVSC
jgi:hypothetical protein